MKNIQLITMLLMVASISNLYAEDIDSSCNNSPEEAVLEIPAPANKFFSIFCTKYGHNIYPSNNWMWGHLIEDSLGFNLFPSQIGKTKLKEVNNDSFFKSIKVRELDKNRTMNKWLLIEDLYSENFKGKLKALEIIAENNLGRKHTIYIFNNNFGYGCSPDCKIDNGFILKKMNRERVTW